MGWSRCQIDNTPRFPDCLRMTSRYATQFAFFVSTVALVACSSASVPPASNSPTPATSSPGAIGRVAIPMSRADSTRAAVRVWLTTGDQQSLLSRQPDLYLFADQSARDTSITTVDIDDARTYQQMIGFGAAMTDASAHLIQKMSAP